MFYAWYLMTQYAKTAGNVIIIYLHPIVSKCRCCFHFCANINVSINCTRWWMDICVGWAATELTLCNGILTWTYTVELTEWPVAKIGRMGSPPAFHPLLQLCHSKYMVITIIMPLSLGAANQQTNNPVFHFAITS